MPEMERRGWKEGVVRDLIGRPIRAWNSDSECEWVMPHRLVWWILRAPTKSKRCLAAVQATSPKRTGTFGSFEKSRGMPNEKRIEPIG